LSRSAFPARAQWDEWLGDFGESDDVSRKIIELRSIESLGAEVMIIRADVGDEHELGAAIGEVYERFGEINGVIHAAGGSGMNSIQEITRLECESHFRAKIRGAHLLGKLLPLDDLDFIVLLSSLASVLGGLGRSAYSAANSFLDAFARDLAQKETAPVLAINYDGWRFDENEGDQPAQSTTIADMTLTPEEGAAVFHSLLSASTPANVIISTGDLQRRIDQWVKLVELRGSTGAQGQPAATLHHRPEVTTQFVAPGNELEREIASIWQDLLGIEGIGINDNFFELGGRRIRRAGARRRPQGRDPAHRSRRARRKTRTLLRAATIVVSRSVGA
jgi:NAD(P)-dependent dehydrogenase (short-subunit alcohol dehydrogenase family)